MRIKGGLLVICMAVLPWARADAPFDPFAAAGIDTSRIGQALPADLTFTDQRGQTVRLGDVLGQRPTLLIPLYFRCPNVCGAALSTLFSQLQPLRYQLGRDYRLIAVSFDPREHLQAAREEQAKLQPRWPAMANSPELYLLTGSAANSTALMQALGFGYRYDPAIGQYAHSSAVAVVTPHGRLSRWLYGLGYQADDLRLALTEAGQGRLGSLGDQLLLLCYHYDPHTGLYSSRIIVALQVAGCLTVLILAGFIGGRLRQERRS
ncbi:electron transport protein SCO1/SenC [Pseudomonas sp. M47T1]|uniref:SCO family protein n=1 Tax=Pseudomonas sp. M47T1 TaxID=1179778 RepID=UPI00026072D2|nr:SCO family protein [Pseudomonas sp. M47T1]EIK94788.1 electron transport protein SCO1/SenC [Pseudomonas sp. M47T1]